MSLFGNLGQNNTTNQPSLFGNQASSTQTGSSLFGTAPSSQAQQKPSLFAGLGGASSQPQQNTGGLFGNLGGATQPQSGPSLFGGAQPQAAQQATSAGGGGLFSNLGGGLGGSATSQPQQSAAGGLFSGLGVPTSQSQTQQPSTGGLFGSLGASTQPAPSGGLFASLAAPSQPPAPDSIFANLGPAPGTNSSQQQQQGQTQQNNGRTTSGASSYFDHLLERGKKRNKQEKGVNQFGELPTLQLGLGDIARKVRDLGSGGPSAQQAQHGRAGDSRARYLLAASGVSTASTLRDLNSFGQQVGTGAPPPASDALDTDVEGYVSNLRTQSMLDLIAEGLEQSKRDFDSFLEENVQMEWDAQRRRIYEHFGLARQGEDAGASVNGAPGAAARGAFGRSTRKGRALGMSTSAAGMSFGASGMARSIIGAPGSKSSLRASVFVDAADNSASSNLQQSNDGRFLREKQERYAEKVKQMNGTRLQELVYPVLHGFTEVESQPGVDDSSQLVDAYKALVEITGEKSSVQQPSEPGVVKERQYIDDYLDETPNSRRGIALRKRILNGSRRYLEKQFLSQLETAITKNPKEANLGGIPTTINKVRAYIRLLSARRELGADNIELQSLRDDYVWVLIFYLLRCGLVKEAADYVAENVGAIRNMDRNFPHYIASYATDPDMRLLPELQTRIASEYSQRARIAPEHSLDPYRMACYKVIGRCEMSKRTLDNISTRVEDWVWLQFALAREVNRVEEAAGDVYGLEDIQGVIQEIGQRHFSPGSEASGSFGMFFFLQILAGMFEQAVSYLYNHNYVSAVHFAIALAYYGLLRVSDYSSSADLLSYTTRQKPQISFGMLLGYYTRDFRTAKPEAATDYLTLICLNADLPGQAGEQQAGLCHESLRELILETREFAQLLGDIRSDGQRIKGAIEQRLKLIKLADQEEFLRTVTIQAASVADDSGRTTDAVLLYHLAEDYDNVITIINRALSEAISVDLGQEHMRLEPLKPRSLDSAQQNGQVQQQRQQQQQQQPDNSSLSLTSVEDPSVLAKNMISVYNANAMYFRKIKPANRDACGVLLRMSEARSRVEAGKWAEALDIIQTLDLLPLTAHGNIAAIRASAQNFNALPPVIARNIGNLLMWTITCCGRQRDVLRASAFEDPTRKQMAEELLVMAKDLMVFAGLIRYKLPSRVFEVLARAGQDAGA